MKTQYRVKNISEFLKSLATLMMWLIILTAVVAIYTVVTLGGEGIFVLFIVLAGIILLIFPAILFAFGAITENVAAIREAVTNPNHKNQT